MADEDMQKLRERRLAQLQEQKGARQGEEPGAEEEKRARQVDVRNSILSQVLDQHARARLSNLRAVKPEKAAEIENMLINMGGSGQLNRKLGEQEFIGLLQQVNEHRDVSKTKVNFDRRRAALDDD